MAVSGVRSGGSLAMTPVLAATTFGDGPTDRSVSLDRVALSPSQCVAPESCMES